MEIPAEGKGKYDIIAGERRFRAMSLLAGDGHFPKDVSLPCEVREGLSAQDRLRLATVENMKRRDLTPLEEAHAIAGRELTGTFRFQ